jgi:glycosyltransferase involved in cell wall biosynthesis
MRRVLVLNHFAVPREQPGGTRHVELFSRLDDWEYTIIASRRNLTTGRPQPDSPHFRFVPVVPYRNNGMTRILNWCSYTVMALLAGLRTPRPDVVYASSPHLLAALAGWLLARFRRARFVLEIRDLWPQTLVAMGHLSETSRLYRGLRGLELFLYRHADRLVAMAPGTIDSLKAAGVEDARICYIPNGADPEDFIPSAERDVLRRRYAFDKITGIYAGAHGPANGLDQLLEAAAQVLDRRVEVVLLGDGVLKPELTTMAAELGLTNVRFLDPVPKSEVVDLLAAADFGIHVLADIEIFRSAVSPNKVFDYLAAGRPVVTNSPGVVGDIIEAANAGITCKPNELAQALPAMAAISPSSRDRLGNNGEEWLRTHHSRALSVRRLREALEALVASRTDSR